MGLDALQQLTDVGACAESFFERPEQPVTAALAIGLASRLCQPHDHHLVGDDRRWQL